MATVTWTEPALRDVVQITAFIARDSPRYAAKVGARLREAGRRLEHQPRVGWMVPEFELEHLREILVRPYRIIYRVEGDNCSILAVIHGSRDLTRHIDPGDPATPDEPTDS